MKIDIQDIISAITRNFSRNKMPRFGELYDAAKDIESIIDSAYHPDPAESPATDHPAESPSP
jgi:hypothetical protein